AAVPWAARSRRQSEDAMTDSSMPPDHALARRAILKGAGLGVGAGLVSALSAQAQTSGAGAAQASGGAVWSAEYWAKKGDGALNLWRKRVGGPKPGEPPLPLLFLVHGSSNSARSSYDLTVPGKGEYSLMNVFARYGYDVWTMDHDGYGYSGSSGNNSDVASSVEDLGAGGGARDRAGEDAFLRHLIGRHPRRRVRAGRARAGGPAGAGRLHLKRHRPAGDRQARAAKRGLPHQQTPQTRARQVPPQLHPA